MSTDRRMEAVDITICIYAPLFSTILLQAIVDYAYLNALIGNDSKSIGKGVYATPNVDPG